jgi:hypothetical protein
MVVVEKVLGSCSGIRRASVLLPVPPGMANRALKPAVISVANKVVPRRVSTVGTTTSCSGAPAGGLHTTAPSLAVESYACFAVTDMLLAMFKMALLLPAMAAQWALPYPILFL